MVGTCIKRREEEMEKAAPVAFLAIPSTPSRLLYLSHLNTKYPNLGGGGGYSSKFYAEWLHPKDQPLTLLHTCTIFDIKGIPITDKWYAFHVPTVYSQ